MHSPIDVSSSFPVRTMVEPIEQGPGGKDSEKPEAAPTTRKGSRTRKKVKFADSEVVSPVTVLKKCMHHSKCSS
jgi:hypothetical protein